MKSLYCSLFGHNYTISKNVTDHVKEYICKHCKEQKTTSGNGYLTLLTPKYKEINSELEKIHTKRLKRKSLRLNPQENSSLVL
ncbi:MAG: hypothetical protein IIC74_08985 [Bacteroidetes bacterium]|nr:hypothetical protein [Bacteroidota bacterium]